MFFNAAIPLTACAEQALSLSCCKIRGNNEFPIVPSEGRGAAVLAT